MASGGAPSKRSTALLERSPLLAHSGAPLTPCKREASDDVPAREQSSLLPFVFGSLRGITRTAASVTSRHRSSAAPSAEHGARPPSRTQSQLLLPTSETRSDSAASAGDVPSRESTPRAFGLDGGAVGCTYAIPKSALGNRLGYFTRELTLVPIDAFSREPKALEAFHMDESHLYVPRFYGLSRWGAPLFDRTSAGLPMRVPFRGELSEVQRQCSRAFLDRARDPALPSVLLGRDGAAGRQAAPKGALASFVRQAPTESETRPPSEGETRECTGTFPRGGIVVLPCGYGKTVFALHTAAQLGRRTLVLVHKTFLIEQWRERAAQFLPGATLGILQQNKVQADADVVVGMIQSIALREYPEEMLDTFGFVVIDEAHHMAAPVFSRAMRKISAKYVLALSATPERKDGMTELLHWSMGSFVFRVQREAESVDVRMLLYEPLRPPRVVLNKEGRPNMALMLNALCKDERRNEMIAAKIDELARGDGRKVIVMSDRVQQLESIAAVLKGLEPIAGEETAEDDAQDDDAPRVLQVSFYIGRSTAQERMLAEQAAVIMTTYPMSREALDIPALDTLVMASPVGEIEQVVGRILRKHSDKQTPLVIDVVDDFSIFGRQKQKRHTFYTKSGYDVSQGLLAHPH